MDFPLAEYLKQIQLDLLRRLIAICEKHDINYFLVGGSCLGAIRHKGFIPWDDDIDVAMLREDYEKFISVAQSELPDHIFLQTLYSEENYPLNFAKLRNSNTTFIETSLSKFDINHGVYIDIFPIDGYPDSKLKRKYREIKDLIYKTRINLEFFIQNKGKPSIKYRIFASLVKKLYPDYKKVVFRREKLLKKYNCNNCKYSANYCGAWGSKEIMETEIYTKTKKLFLRG